jgi:hypothetical protein
MLRSEAPQCHRHENTCTRAARIVDLPGYDCDCFLTVNFSFSSAHAPPPSPGWVHEVRARLHTVQPPPHATKVVLRCMIDFSWSELCRRSCSPSALLRVPLESAMLLDRLCQPRCLCSSPRSSPSSSSPRGSQGLSPVLLTLALDVAGPVHALHAAPSGEGSIRRCFCGRRTKISCRRCSCPRQRQARYRQHWGNEANIARARPPLIRWLQPARTSTAPLFYPNSSICCHRTL